MTDELKYAIRVAKEAGEKALEFYGGHHTVKQKSNDTPVTEADIAVDAFIHERLTEKFSYPILSEEAKDDLTRMESDTIWCVDPIDGTHGFIKGNDFFAVQIGLIHKERAILGVVYRPTHKELHFGERDFGAYFQCGDESAQRIHVGNGTNVSKMKMVTHPYGGYKLGDDVIIELGITEFIRSGGAGLRIGFVSRGENAICMTSSPKSSEWDTCAPQIILEEAGGKLTDICGGELLYNQKDTGRPKGFVATNGIVHDTVIHTISKMLC